MIITHLNLANEANGIYCCLRNKIVIADQLQKSQFCLGCKMYQGDLAGKGIACRWEDLRRLDNPYIVTDPYKEWMINQQRKVQMPISMQDGYPYLDSTK